MAGSARVAAQHLSSNRLDCSSSCQGLFWVPEADKKFSPCSEEMFHFPLPISIRVCPGFTLAQKEGTACSYHCLQLTCGLEKPQGCSCSTSPESLWAAAWGAGLGWGRQQYQVGPVPPSTHSCSLSTPGPCMLYWPGTGAERGNHLTTVSLAKLDTLCRLSSTAGAYRLLGEMWWRGVGQRPSCWAQHSV